MRPCPGYPPIAIPTCPHDDSNQSINQSLGAATAEERLDAVAHDEGPREGSNDHSPLARALWRRVEPSDDCEPLGVRVEHLLSKEREEAQARREGSEASERVHT